MYLHERADNLYHGMYMQAPSRLWKVSVVLDMPVFGAAAEPESERSK